MTLARISVAILVLWQPILSIVLSAVFDTFDGTVLAAAGVGAKLHYENAIKHYHKMDKPFDEFEDFMLLVYAAIHFNSDMFILAAILFLYRLVGFILFEIFHKRVIFIIFANIVEFYLMIAIICQVLFPATYMQYNTLIFFVAVVTKIANELYLHGQNQLSLVRKSLNYSNLIRKIFRAQPLRLPAKFS